MASEHSTVPSSGPARLHRAAVGRADLLRLLDRLGDGAAASVARLTGFDEPARAEIHVPATAVLQVVPGEVTVQVGPGPAPLGRLQAQHYGIVARDSQTPSDRDDANPLDGDGPLDEAPIRADLTLPVPSSPALASPRRLASFIRAVFRRPMPTRELDVSRWVAQVAAGRMPRQLPVRQLPHWGSGGALCVNGSADLEPLNDDLQALVAAVLRWSGGRVDVRWRDGQGQWWSRLPGPSRRNGGWRKLADAQAASFVHGVLVGSAQGLPAPAARHLGWTWPLARQGDRPGNRLTVLSPDGVAGSTWPASARVVRWDHGQRLQAQRIRPVAARVAEHSLADLLACASMAVRVEPPLLRAMRLRLGLSAAAEVEAWQHDDVEACALAMQLRTDRSDPHRRHLRTVPLPLRQDIAQMIEAFHARLSPLIRDEERAMAADLAPGTPGLAGPNSWLSRARTLAQRPVSAGALDAASYVRRLAARMHPEVWSAVPGLAETWVLAEQDQVRSGAALPTGLPAAAVARVMGRSSRRSAGRLWTVVQRGRSLSLAATGASPAPGAMGTFGPFARESGVLVSQVGGTTWRRLAGSSTELFELTGPGPWILSGGDHTIEIAAIPRPVWAEEWGRDAMGLYALTPLLGDHRGRFKVIEADPTHPFTHWDEVEVRGEVLPMPTDGATAAFGIDRDFGLFVDLAVGQATQRLRWIAPGEFWMGSTDDERALFGDKTYEELAEYESPRHRVRLSQGFWLADSACTQALWQAVMGDNPSRFKDDPQLPVEQVSWDDVQGFLARLQPLLPAGCQAVLPTEAEWEYACRAGTEGPFNLGEQIAPRQVNFDGNHSYAGGEIGRHRGKTVPVTVLPPNAWGLYEMHGNVWEWCDDGLRNYAESGRDGLVLNPTGPREQGSSAPRAVRGGSWVSTAWMARSAFRFAFQRVDRLGDLGFRLALMSTVQDAPEGPASSQESPAEPARAVRPEPEARDPARRDNGPARGRLAALFDRWLPDGNEPTPTPKKKPKRKP